MRNDTVNIREKLSPEVLEAVKAAATEGRLSCVKAHELAAQYYTPLRLIGHAADELGLKLVECQLGCF